MYDKELWKRSIEFIAIDNIPSWPCPTCENGVLRFDESSLRFVKSKQQFKKEDFKKDNFDDSLLLGLLAAIAQVGEKLLWNQARFTAFLNCSCGEVVAVCGRAEIPSDIQKTNNYNSPSRIIPEYFSPPLPIFKFKSEYPLSVARELVKSFSVFFADTSSAANKLRISVERLLDELHVNKGQSLHARIEKYRATEPNLGEMLLGVKELGNEASHTGNMVKEDILDAYNIVHYVLEEVFIRRSEGSKLLSKSSELRSRYKRKKN